MIEWIGSWAQGIIVAVIIGTIIEMILPEGNSKKYIKVVIGLYILFSIISPLVNKFTGRTLSVSDIIDLDEYIETVNNQNNNLYNSLDMQNSNNIRDIYINGLKNDIKSKVKGKGFETLSIDVDVANNEEYTLKSITLKLYKTENEEEIEEVNQINNIDTVDINISNEEKNEVNETIDITKSEKNKLKEYLSMVYEISEKKIFIN